MRKADTNRFGSTRRTWLKQTSAMAAAWACGQLPNAVSVATASPDSPRTIEWALQPVMQKAAACCLAWLNPQQHYLPTGGYEIAHDTGRWWDAMLRCQAVTALPIPEWAEAAMVENLQRLTDNPAGLLTNDAIAEQAGGVRQVNPHNFRESMLAYSALVKWRQHVWSREHGSLLIQTTDSLLAPDGQLDYGRLAQLMQLPLNPDPSMVQRSPAGTWFDATGTTGRAIEGFVCFHEATASEPALQLAARLAAVHRQHVTHPDGKVPPEILAPQNVGHNHSYLGTLRGLLRYGLCSGRTEYVESVARTYRNGLFGTNVSESGWTPHDLGKSRFPNEHGDPLGEHGSCADVVQLALWLATLNNQADLWDDVERILRARLLPSQIDDPSQPRRHGSWGVYAHPFDRGTILDVFAAVLSVMTEVQQAVVTTHSSGAVCVNLHLSIDSPLATVIARRSDEGVTSVKYAKPTGVRVRLPGWSPRDQARMTVDGQPVSPRWEGTYAVLPPEACPAGASIELRYTLPTRTTVETLPVSKQQYQLSWRGDDVVGCDPEVPLYR